MAGPSDFPFLGAFPLGQSTNDKQSVRTTDVSRPVGRMESNGGDGQHKRTPAQRRASGRLGGLLSWSRTADPSARTAPGRSKFQNSFEREVLAEHPELDPERDAALVQRLANFRK